MRESRGSKSQIGPFVRQPENSVLRGVPGANADPLACAPSERVVVQDPRIICQLLQVANMDPDARWPCKPNGAYVHVACDDKNGRLYGARLKFSSPNAYQVYIPGCVREICWKYFWKLGYVDLVTFGTPSLLERIGFMAFARSSLSEISIPDSVRELGDRCFYRCRLRRVTFGAASALERIGTEAFSSNDGLYEIKIPDRVRELACGCFSSCRDLSKVEFGTTSSLEFIGVGAFKNTGITDITIPDSVRELCERCFCDCGRLRKVIFGESSSLRRIGAVCFAETKVKEISIPDTVCELCDECFCQCTELTRVTFGPSSSLKRIGVRCFARSGLKHCQIPQSVTSIGGGAFSECPIDPSGIILCSDSPFRMNGNLLLNEDCTVLHSLIGVARAVVIPECVEELYDYCFSDCSNLCSVTFAPNSSLKRIGIGAFRPGPGPGYEHVVEFAFLWSTSTSHYSIDIPDSVQNLCDECFCMSKVTQVILAATSSLERIGVDAFTQCLITEIYIPNSVRELCDRCFYKCAKLERVTFGDSSSIQRIGTESFAMTKLVEINIPDSVCELADRCFYACRDLTRVIFGESSSLKRIGTEVFSETSISSIIIPSTVQHLSDRCFRRCMNMINLQFDPLSSLKSIGAEVLSDDTQDLALLDLFQMITTFACRQQTSFIRVVIPDGVEELCDRGFFGCKRLEKVVFGESSSLRRIGAVCFAETKVKEISIPDTVCELCDECFCQCTELTRVTFGPSSSLKRIGVRCFARSGLKHCQIPQSVTSIGGGAFSECPIDPSGIILCSDSPFRMNGNLLLNEDCTVLHSLIGVARAVVIPKCVEELYDYCFSDCSHLCSVTFAPNSSLKRIGVLAFSPSPNPQLWAHAVRSVSAISEITVPDHVREIGDHCFLRCGALVHIKFGASSLLERIGVEALRETSITEISIPDHLRELCDRCFCGCEKLARVTFGAHASLERINDGVCQISIAMKADLCHICDIFFGCVRRDFPCEINIPDSVQSLGDRCFFCFERLQKVSFGSSSSLRQIGRACFTGSAVKEIVVPDSVRELGDRCFCGCTKLQSLTLSPSSELQRIGVQCFAFSGLKHLQIPRTVTYIGGGAFNQSKILPHNVVLCQGSPFQISDGLVLNLDGKVCHSYVGNLWDTAIPDSVEELCDDCFCGCAVLGSIIFGPRSSLKRIGAYAFSLKIHDFKWDGKIVHSINEITIPNGVCELCEGCFSHCCRLQRVSFASPSSVKRIGVSAFRKTEIQEINIPDSVEELCDKCFKGCRSLTHVGFGEASVLERMGSSAFSGTNLVQITIPDSVREIGSKCFAMCRNFEVATISAISSLECIGDDAFIGTKMKKVQFPVK